MVRLRWIASSRASALHAAAALASGRKVVDARLSEALTGPTAALAFALREASVPIENFFQHAIPLACEMDEPSEMAPLAVRKAIGREFSPRECGTVAAALVEIFAAQARAFPGMANQLQVRGAPLAEQWEARGPGLLAAMGRLTDRGLLVEQADAALVYPALGGGGAASLAYNLVRVEAVLANPHARLPEVARLGWLVAQLNFDLPKFGGGIAPDRLARLAGLTMAPAALAAAECVELARSDVPTLRLALAVWGLADDREPDLAEMLTSWWQAWSKKPGEWSVALAAIDAMTASRTSG